MLLTPHQVAEELQLSVATLSRMCTTGDIPHVILRAGRRKRVIRFRREDLDRWLNTRTRGGKRQRSGNADSLLELPGELSRESISENENGNGPSHRSSQTEERSQ